jgi:hypothetical protein
MALQDGGRASKLLHDSIADMLPGAGIASADLILPVLRLIQDSQHIDPGDCYLGARTGRTGP